VKAATDYRFRNERRLGKCRECERAYQRDWSRRDPEKFRKRKRESMAKRRSADPVAARAYRNQYHAANRAERTAKMREYYGRRFFWGRAMKLRGADRATYRDLARLWRQQRGRCALSGRRLDRTAQLDHIMPRARGGSDAASNIRWVCYAANLAKRDLTDAEFAALCSDVMAWIGERIALVDRALLEGDARHD
jgi:5-methylcytosine-specific restriction endonuclease McrA